MHIAIFIWSSCWPLLSLVWRKICVVTAAWQQTCHWCDEWQNVTDVMKDMRCHCIFCHCCLQKDTCCQWCDERHVLQQFSSVQPSLSDVSPTMALKQFRLTDDGPLSSFQVRSSSVPLSMPLLQATDGVMSLALCSLVVSQAPQHFRSPETHGSVTNVTYVSHFFTPRQLGTDVTKDMCCHWKTCCSCCLTKDLFCHWCDEGHVAGVMKDICYHRCYEKTGVVTVWRKRHMFALMFQRTCVVTDVMRRQVLSLV